MAVGMRRPSRFAKFSWQLAAGGTFMAGLAAAPTAAAQTVSPEDMAAARALGTDGVHMADAGDCAGAIPKLTAAEKLFHAPTTMERLGECEIKVGKLVAGTEHLQHVIREPLPPNPPPAFLAARQKAQDALGPALPRIARLRVHVDGVAGDKVTTTIDGEPMSSALLDAPRPTDPGAHEVKAVAAGFKPAGAMVTLAEGGEASVSLRLDPDPNAVAAPAVPAAPGQPAAPAPAPGGPAPTTATTVGPAPAQPSSTPVAAIALLVAGGVGVGVGTIFGVVAMGAKSNLDNECGTSKKDCPKQGDIDSLNTDATISDIGFGIGVVGLAVGAILLVTHHNSEAAASTAPHVTPWIGLGTAGLGGTFQ
jgi:hypothetical protein